MKPLELTTKPMMFLVGIGLTRPSLIGLMFIQSFLIVAITATTRFLLNKKGVQSSFLCSHAILLSGSALASLTFSVLILGQRTPQGIVFATLATLYGTYIARYILPMLPLPKEMVTVTILVKEENTNNVLQKTEMDIPKEEIVKEVVKETTKEMANQMRETAKELSNQMKEVLCKEETV